MKICNRKLAARIAGNESAVIKLVGRLFASDANLAEVKKAMADCRAQIAADTQALLQHGYDVKGNLLPLASLQHAARNSEGRA